MAEQQRVAVVGAGISGLCAVKSCLEEGLEPVCFEQFDNIGGVWYSTEKYREGQGPRIYDHLTTNTSKEMIAYSDFPYPREAPVYLACDEVFRYLNSYCDHFGLRKYIHLNTKVKNISKADDYETTGKWLVETEDSVIVKQTFHFVMVCAGNQKHPKYPDIPGMNLFKGTMEHSMIFENGRKFKDKNVLVVGNGFSAADVASFTSEYANRVSMSVGVGMLIVPKTVKKGLPWEFAVINRALFRNRKNVLKTARKLAYDRLDHDNAGVTPTVPLLKSKICLHDHLQIQIYTGKVKIVPRLVRLGPKEAEFDDGTIIKNIDSIVFATGYTRVMDFLEDDAKGGGGDKLSLYKMIFPLQLSQATLAIIGCIATDGSFPPLQELQCRVAARVFSGRLSLPSKDRMRQDVDRWNEELFRLHGSYRYKVPSVVYPDELAAELGVSPTWWDLIKAGPRMAYLYYFGPAFPYYYRMWGPHRWPGARQAIEDALHHGHYTIQQRKIHHNHRQISKEISILTLVIAFVVMFIAFAACI